MHRAAREDALKSLTEALKKSGEAIKAMLNSPEYKQAMDHIKQAAVAFKKSLEREDKK